MVSLVVEGPGPRSLRFESAVRPRATRAPRCRGVAPACASGGAAPGLGAAASGPSKALRDPVELTAATQARVAVEDAGGEAALSAYMTLPVEQYFVLDPESVTRLGGSVFRCRVPRLAFLSVWLEPEIDVEVLISATHVRMRSVATRLRGSEFVERASLNDHFDMRWSTTLTTEVQDERCSFIAVETDLQVWCEVLPPFHLVPRSFLATACNAVLRRALPALLFAFVRQLGGDYRRWSTEPAYRATRAAAGSAAAAPPPLAVLER